MRTLGEGRSASERVISMSGRKVRQALVAAVSAVLVAGAAAARWSPACAVQTLPTVPVAPTTATTIEQAYYCVFAHYVTGPVLDDRVLLAGAFAGFTQELGRLGLDQPDATMPALTGDRGRDWNAFAAVYRKVTGQPRATPTQRQALAAATLTGMVASLLDNLARWVYLPQPPG